MKYCSIYFSLGYLIIKRFWRNSWDFPCGHVWIWIREGHGNATVRYQIQSLASLSCQVMSGAPSLKTFKAEPIGLVDRAHTDRECWTGGFLSTVSHKSSVPYQCLATERLERHAAPRPEVIGWEMHESPSVNILLMAKLLNQNPLSWDMDCFLSLWPLLIPCSLGNTCCTFGFLIFITAERNSLYNSLNILTEISLKHPFLHQRLGSPCLSFFRALSLPPVNPSSSLPCRGFQELLERAPRAFVSSANLF